MHKLGLSICSRDILRPRSSAFIPTDLTGVAAWYRSTASVFEGILSGAAVSQWNDLSGNSRHLTQSTGVSQPTYSATSLGGKPGVAFDGANDSLATSGFTFAQPITMFILGNFSALVSYGCITDGIALNDSLELYGNGTASNVTLWCGAGHGSLNVSSGINLISAKANGASSGVRKNRGSYSSGNAGTRTPGGFKLGDSATGSANNGNFICGEVVLFNRLLDSGEDTKMLDYFTEQWGIS